MSDKKIINQKEKEEKTPQFKTIKVSGGLVCDFETGICGPADKIESLKEEDKKNENNNLV